MRRSSPYCQSNTPAKAQSPVKIIQRSRGARSGTLKASMSDDMVVTLMFFVLPNADDEAAFVHLVLPPFWTSCEPKPRTRRPVRSWNSQSPSFRVRRSPDAAQRVALRHKRVYARL